MKKRGFTLAEILVSLGVIGIVSATVLPTFISNHKTQVYEATRKTTESALENAFSSMMAADLAKDLSFTKIWADGADMYSTLTDYFKASSADSEISGGVGFRTKSGAIISIKKNGDGAEVRIDVNGADGPNVRDTDIFLYLLELNGTLEYCHV